MSSEDYRPRGGARQVGISGGVGTSLFTAKADSSPLKRIRNDKWVMAGATEADSSPLKRVRNDKWARAGATEADSSPLKRVRNDKGAGSSE
jgi:hypothetical protein